MKKRFSAVLIFFVVAVLTLSLNSCKKETNDAFNQVKPDAPTPPTPYAISYSTGSKAMMGLVYDGDTIYAPTGKVTFDLIPSASADWNFYTSTWASLYSIASVNQSAYVFSSLGWYKLVVTVPPSTTITVTININSGIQPITPKSVRYVGAWYNQTTNEQNYVFRGPKTFLTAAQFFQVGDGWNNSFAAVFSGVHLVGADSLDIEIPFPATTAPSLKKFCYGGVVGGTNTWITGCDGLWHNGLSGSGNDLWWFFPSYGTAVAYGGNTATVPGVIPDNNGAISPDIAPLTITGGSVRVFCFNPPLSYNALIGAGTYLPSFHYKMAPHYDPFPTTNWITATFTQLATNKSYYYADVTMPPNMTMWFEWSQALTFIPLVNIESMSDSWDVVNNACKVSN